MRRIVKPPGGECSDIFGIQNGMSSPVQEQITPRKTNNYMQSTIFSPDSVDSPPSSNGHSPATPSKMLDTQDRLFGSSPDDNTPRRMVNRQRSSIFEDEGSDHRPRHTPGPKHTPGRQNAINPITGEPVKQNGLPNGSTNGTSNGVAHGTNGYMNGHSSPDSPMNGNSFRVRNPPGGKSSGIF